MSFPRRPLHEVLGKRGYIRGPFGSALKRRDLSTESGFPVYEQQHAIYGDRQFRFFIDNEKYSELKRFETATNDLIISCSGTVGRISVIKEQDPQGIISQALLILRPDTNEILPYFLYYFLTSNEGYNSLIDASHGTVQSNIAKRSIVESIEVPSPDLKQQETVVGILKTLDDKITLNRKLNETLEGIARALFQSWFVDFDPVKAKLAAVRHGRDPDKACMAALSGKLRIPPGKPKPDTLYDQLPTAEDLDTAITTLDTLTEDQQATLAQTAAHFPSEFEYSALGLIPQGWQAKPLYNTAKFVNGAAFKSDHFTDEEGALPIIKIAELKQGISAQTKFTRSEVKERHRINNGDLLYSWSGSPGTSLEVFKWFGGEGWLNQHIFKINTSSKIKSIFVWLLLKHLKPELIRIAENKQTTGLGHVTVADMKRIFVAYPDADCLAAFGKLVEPIYEHHSSCIVESNTLAQLRDTLLPKLLSGDIELTN